MSIEDGYMFLPGINGRRHKFTNSVCFRLYYAGLSVESEELKLSMTPTSPRCGHYATAIVPFLILTPEQVLNLWLSHRSLHFPKRRPTGILACFSGMATVIYLSDNSLSSLGSRAFLYFAADHAIDLAVRSFSLGDGSANAYL
jgi:hypothetical protein